MDSLAKVIAASLWGQECADLYFDPRHDASPDVRRGEAQKAATAVRAWLGSDEVADRVATSIARFGNDIAGDYVADVLTDYDKVSRAALSSITENANGR